MTSMSNRPVVAHDHRNSRSSQQLCAQAGFSMIEMMVVIFVISLIMGAVFQSINLTQQTSISQQAKLDLTQQAREFVDQLSRDLRSAGYPNSRNMSTGATDPNNVGVCPDGTTNLLTSPCDPTNGVGLIKIDVSTLWFAGDVDGTQSVPGYANVKTIRYDLVAAGAGEPGCPCLRRTEYLRANYEDPVQDATNTTATEQLEIQGVQNGTAADPIFTAYDPTTGLAVTLPLDFTNDAATIAKINSLKVVLAVKAKAPDINGVYPVTRVVASMALSNCSEALGGQTLSC
jgi:prepilin-type N-terminal cleavage/methylation domain-containing protein